ncbi:MAG: VWA domain-containing protein, partial [Chloroflexia bacterium]|nr:VWA domain-containing protein [Chloroflexia bacterium]
GSMEGEKIVQAKSAVTYILEHLNPEDRFAIVEFSTGARIYSRSLEPASATAEAIPWVERLMATGGTDINLALLEGLALAETERPTTLLFLTDGLPTEGETDPTGILANVAAAAPANVRLFAFGVGDDVDTFLLDSLVAAHHGTSTYVRPGQAVDETVSAFYAGISSPVLANLEVEFGDVVVEDLYPKPLPDLFAGGQLVLIGRYRDGGPATITLSGEVNGERQSFSYDGLRFATNEEADFLPRLWATRRIGYLLNQIRLQGEQREWVDAIVDLSVRYGIVTPYTSYLFTEDDILSAEGRTRVANDTFDALQNTPPPPSSGAAAVNEAQNSGQMAAADVAQAPAAEYGEQIRLVGDRAFVLLDGVWTETTFDPESMTPIEVPFASDEYFALLSSHPDLAAAFALGQGVIAISDGLAYQVVPVAA